MQRKAEAELNEVAAQAAGRYITEKFKQGREIEKNLILNSYAHGFFMGARHCEATHNLGTFGIAWIKLKGLFTGDYLPVYPTMDDDWIESHGIRAGNFYVKQMKYHRMNLLEQTLVRASIGMGFKKGFVSRGISEDT